MTPFFPRPGRLAANAFEAAVENAILRADDLYDLDGETAFRRRDGRVETGSFDSFEKETF